MRDIWGKCQYWHFPQIAIITPAIKHITSHAGLDPASSLILDSRFRDCVIYCCRSYNERIRLAGAKSINHLAEMATVADRQKGTVLLKIIESTDFIFKHLGEMPVLAFPPNSIYMGLYPVYILKLTAIYRKCYYWHYR